MSGTHAAISDRSRTAFACNDTQNTFLTSMKSHTDMPSGHGVRRTSLDTVTPLDELASERMGNLSKIMQALDVLGCDFFEASHGSGNGLTQMLHTLIV